MNYRDIEPVWDDIAEFDFPFIANADIKQDIDKLSAKLMSISEYYASVIQFRAIVKGKIKRAYFELESFDGTDDLGIRQRVLDLEIEYQGIKDRCKALENMISVCTTIINAKRVSL